jgi:hypothetical protein
MSERTPQEIAADAIRTAEEAFEKKASLTTGEGAAHGEGNEEPGRVKSPPAGAAGTSTRRKR